MVPQLNVSAASALLMGVRCFGFQVHGHQEYSAAVPSDWRHSALMKYVQSQQTNIAKLSLDLASLRTLVNLELET